MPACSMIVLVPSRTFLTLLSAKPLPSGLAGGDELLQSPMAFAAANNSLAASEWNKPTG